MAPCVPKQHTYTLVPHTKTHSHIPKHIAVPAWPHGSMAEALSVDGEHGAARGAAAQRARSVAVRQHGSEQSGRAHQSCAWLAQEKPLAAARALPAPRQRPSPASRHAVHVAPEHTTASTSTAAVRQRLRLFGPGLKRRHALNTDDTAHSVAGVVLDEVSALRAGVNSATRRVVHAGHPQCTPLAAMNEA